MGAVAEHQHRQLGQFHAHHGVGDRQGVDGCRGFGDGDRGAGIGRLALATLAILAFFVCRAGKHHLAGRGLRRLGRGRVLVVVDQPPLEAAQALDHAVRGLVEGNPDIVGSRVPAQLDSRARVDRYIGSNRRPFPRKLHLGLDRSIEMFADRGDQTFFDVAP